VVAAISAGQAKMVMPTLFLDRDQAGIIESMTLASWASSIVVRAWPCMSALSMLARALT
jgi:hypothetical protein